MEGLINSYKKSGHLHHAYFLIGDKNQIYKSLISFFENDLKFKTSTNPDFWSGDFHNFSIDDSRVVSDLAERKSVLGGVKIFVIKADFLTTEAQNSLLKTFEEPTGDTHFFIISPQDSLLPTLKSRVSIIIFSGIEKKGEAILSLKLSKRLEKVKEITDGISDEEKTKQDAISFLNQVEEELYKKGTEVSRGGLRVCETTRRSLYDRGAPIKIILENLMLSV